MMGCHDEDEGRGVKDVEEGLRDALWKWEQRGLVLRHRFLKRQTRDALESKESNLIYFAMDDGKYFKNKERLAHSHVTSTQTTLQVSGFWYVDPGSIAWARRVFLGNLQLPAQRGLPPQCPM